MAIIDVIKFNGLASRDWIVYKHPTDKLVKGSQLIVGEGQNAVFVKGGKICDSFTPGTYSLNASNLPILQSVVNIPFGGKTPFPAEIYFINLTTKLDLAWGTSDPIQLIDPKFQIRLNIRAFGQAGLKVQNSQFLITELVGSLASADIVNYTKVMDWFKGILISKVKSVIANVIITEKISALDISAKLEEISVKVNDVIAPEFGKFGFTMVNFFIKSINFPPEDFEAINKILEDKAAFELMGDSRYKTMRSFDVYEGAATNQNGVAGAFAAGGIGVGAGMAIGSSMGSVMSPITSNNDILCPSCNIANSADAKFCKSCGKPMVELQARISCPFCQAMIPAGSKFCNECGKKIEEKKCSCGGELSPNAKFCNNCGKKVEEV